MFGLEIGAILLANKGIVMQGEVEIAPESLSESLEVVIIAEGEQGEVGIGDGDLILVETGGFPADLVHFINSEGFVAVFEVGADFAEKAGGEGLAEALKLGRDRIDDFIAVVRVFADTLLEMLADEGVSEDFVGAEAIGEDAADAVFEGEKWIWDGAGEGASGVVERNVVVAEETTDFFDEVFADVDVGTPGGDGDLEG